MPNLLQCSRSNGSKSRLAMRSKCIYCYLSYPASILSRCLTFVCLIGSSTMPFCSMQLILSVEIRLKRLEICMYTKWVRVYEYRALLFNDQYFSQRFTLVYIYNMCICMYTCMYVCICVYTNKRLGAVKVIYLIYIYIYINNMFQNNAVTIYRCKKAKVSFYFSA